MKKSLLIVLLVLFVFTLWTVMAFGKATKTEKPTQVQKTEQNVEPQFPKVALPPAVAAERIMKGTPEDFQKAVQAKKGRTPVQIQQLQEQPVRVPDVNTTEEAMPNYCVIQNIDAATCCYYQAAGNPYLRCWGVVRFLTLLDIDNNNATPACAFPYYPFDVDTVRVQLYAGDACSLYVKARVYNSYQMDPDCRWLTTPAYYSDSMWVQHPGGFAYVNIPFLTDACVSGPFFAMVYIMNTDDFVDSAAGCPSAPFQFGLSWVFDASGRECISYWGSPSYTDGYLYDVVTNGIINGPMRIRAVGHTATDNLCTPPVDEWYYKDSLALAPGGVPDFDQGQMPPAFCGPTAGADILWWQLANNSGLAMPVDVPTLINQIAAASGTIPGTGTVCDALEAGLLQVVKSIGGWWFAETTIYQPDFVYLQKWTRQCHTMTLLLGFWQNQGGNWVRFGGHFVAVSGVDIFAPTYQVALSDPAIDNAEAGGPGLVKHPVDPWPHVGNFVVHNNPADASRDWYPVAWPSASPGGYLYLPTYVPHPDTIVVCDSIVCDPIPPKNHFKTWRTAPEPFGSTVFVQDQFMDDSLRLTGIEFLSNPAKKDTFEILDLNHHLTWYRAEGTASTRQVIYENQFGRNAVTIDSVKYLLVPTQKLPLDPPVGLDHYKAYRIKDPVAFHRSTLLEDQFDILSGAGPELIDSLKPVYFLTPAIKNLEPGYDPLTHYVAYEIFPKRPFSLLANTVDQFGTHTLPVLNSELLLVPTTKCHKLTVTVPNWYYFQGQNAGPFPNTGDWNPCLPVQVEVEQLIDFYQGTKRLTGEVDGSNVDEINNNMGGITPFDVLFGATVVSPLYYGSLFSGTSQADLRGDYGDYYPSYSFTPLGPPVVDTWTVTGKAGDYDIMMLTVNFGHGNIPGLDYNMYAFGVTVPAGGGADIKYVVEDVYVLENDGATEITGLEKALFFDYDIGGNAALVDWDQQHASLWMWDLVATDTVFGLTEVPAVKGVVPITGWGVSNATRIYDKQYVDSMKYYMENLGWGSDGVPAGEDMSLLLADPAFNLPVAGLHINKYIKWGYNKAIATGGDADWRHFLYGVLQTLGYYRGDVDKNGKFDVADVIYMVNYLLKSGPKPIEFTDQMDVDGNNLTNVADVIYSVNNRFKGGPYPIDKERFYEGAPIPVNHKGLSIRESLFNDAAWKTLGQ